MIGRIRTGRASFREIVMASAGILTAPKFERRLEMIAQPYAKPDFIARFRVPDPFNRPGEDIDRDALRSSPPAWRTIDGGRAGERGPLTTDDIRERGNSACIARHYYRADGVADRLERELAEDIKRFGRTWETRTGFPLAPINGGSTA